MPTFAILVAIVLLHYSNNVLVIVPFVCPALASFCFLVLHIQVDRRDGGGEGEESMPAGRYECDSCGRVYRHLTLLRRHRGRAHIGRMVCLECDSMF